MKRTETSANSITADAMPPTDISLHIRDTRTGAVSRVVVRVSMLSNVLRLQSFTNPQKEDDSEESSTVGPDTHLYSSKGLAEALRTHVIDHSDVGAGLRKVGKEATSIDYHALFQQVLHQASGYTSKPDALSADQLTGTSVGGYTIYDNLASALEGIAQAQGNDIDDRLLTELNGAFFDHFGQSHLTTRIAAVFALDNTMPSRFWILSAVEGPGMKEETRLRLWNIRDLVDGDLVSREMSPAVTDGLDEEVLTYMKERLSQLPRPATTADYYPGGRKYLTLFRIPGSEGMQICLVQQHGLADTVMSLIAQG